MKKTDLKKAQLYITHEQDTFFRKQAEDKGTTFSECIRSALEMYVRIHKHTPTVTYPVQEEKLFIIKKKLPLSQKNGLVIIPPELWDEYVEIQEHE